MAARHRVFDRTSAKPAAYRGPVSEAWRLLCLAYLKLSGWRIEGDWPRDIAKMTLVAAPHTSNWDGVNMLAAAGYYRVPLKWMGKKELTTGPLGGLVKWLGCIPVDRDKGGDLVKTMAEAFAAAKTLTLAVAPEGTRAATPGWRSGFYYIALAAGAPIVMSVLDYGTKTIALSGALEPSGDYEADLKLIQSHYAGARGLSAGNFSLGR
ncbi:MAG: 1-acyl-sn-glycerol-3-phosphate acyltransferase [Parvularculaceae bacterium]|nr:1-acyl-sn-glycerol-3-phosphate acyltransferase [Parvularculaceae bacterium]